MNIFNEFREIICQMVTSLYAKTQDDAHSSIDLSRISVEPPRESTHGDLATNAAMVLAKFFKKKPQELADILANELSSHPNVDSAVVAGPGFINLHLRPTFWQKQLPFILKHGIHYGDSVIGKGEKVNVEYVSVNPTGPMHAGHGRNAIFGDAIASLLEKIGCEVTREYYINDAGGQTIALARSAYLRYLEALGHRISPDAYGEDMYRGDYLIPTGKMLADKYGDQWVDQPEGVWMEPIRHFVIDIMMQRIREDLADVGITMDLYSSESEVVQRLGMDTVLKTLTASDDIYVGSLEKPKGHDDDDWEPRPQVLFRSTAYGDDVDRALQKSDGSWTYFASDILYHYDKISRGYTRLIDILGADHAGYLKRITAVVQALGQKKVAFDIKTCQLVHFIDNGIPVKMSKRAGTFITLKDVIDRVGKDVVRFIMLTRRQDVGIDFDFDKVIEQTKENPVFYVQYAHARACSVLRHGLAQLSGSIRENHEANKTSEMLSEENFHHLLQKSDLSLLTCPEELEMIKILVGWPRHVEIAALALEPHRIAYYLYDIAAGFHLLWNKGKEQAHLRFIDPNNQAYTTAKLALVKSVATVLASGLHLLKITPLEEMR